MADAAMTSSRFTVPHPTSFSKLILKHRSTQGDGARHVPGSLTSVSDGQGRLDLESINPASYFRTFGRTERRL